ncbi:hypothetical protein [Streptomyces spectabilis]|uniref:Transcriptional regulator with XRE-family HTH domain n=1 Tax=Streptomyces spectabilis TaxID=68270 RepID=A0A5P2X7Q0_STRST|nr:hypothetical protein [Streptomyces spectabilis]MBB5107782.1 transcriptional regulator with XRE-family HTH domain [Streptomyces spectabilis]MCI3903220.1 hypothetical protein [Streptomyces spectabilis]QEV60451.1 hypothetical protein CP982_18405 [Streptomyces spectabilis]GGV38643.1 hypothetical protein GCM10010245_61280 [Streptomyces spectabilis]
MTEITDFASLRHRAITLRRAGLSLRQIADALQVRSKDLLQRLVEGEPAPEWTKRPRAKDDLRERARELRLKGWTYNQIQAELGCSKSSVSLWVRDLPKPERPDPSEQAKLAARKRWEHELAVRDEERRRTKAVWTAEVGSLSDREAFLAGVVLYWAEGTKDKAYSRRERLAFINSDPNVIAFYLHWLDLQGVERERLRLRVSIHESADVAEAEAFWADLVGMEASTLQKTTIKKHNPRTVRKNTSEAYRGCLAIYVLKSAELYRRMEGAWYGIVLSAREADQQNRT